MDQAVVSPQGSGDTFTVPAKTIHQKNFSLAQLKAHLQLTRHPRRHDVRCWEKVGFVAYGPKNNLRLIDSRSSLQLRETFIRLLNQLQDGDEVPLAWLMKRGLFTERQAIELVRWAMEKGLLNRRPYQLYAIDHGTPHMRLRRKGDRFPQPALFTLNDALLDERKLLQAYAMRKVFTAFLAYWGKDVAFSIEEATDLIASTVHYPTRGPMRWKLESLTMEEIGWAIGAGIVRQNSPLVDGKEPLNTQKVFSKISDASALDYPLEASLDMPQDTLLFAKTTDEVANV